MSTALFQLVHGINTARSKGLKLRDTPVTKQQALQLKRALEEALESIKLPIGRRAYLAVKLGVSRSALNSYLAGSAPESCTFRTLVEQLNAFMQHRG